MEAAAARLAAETAAKSEKIAADLASKEAKRAAALSSVASKGAKESAKVEAAAAKLQAEADAKLAKLNERLENAEMRKAEAYGRHITALQQRTLEAAVRLDEAEEATLVRGAYEARREVNALMKHEEHLANVAAKAKATSDKVEAASARRATEAEQLAARLADKQAAAEARKAEVRYPPCSRVKPAPAPAPVLAKPSKRFSAIKALFAGVVGGAVARGLTLFGTKYLSTAALKAAVKGAVPALKASMASVHGMLKKTA